MDGWITVIATRVNSIHFIWQRKINTRIQTYRHRYILRISYIICHICLTLTCLLQVSTCRLIDIYIYYWLFNYLFPIKLTLNCNSTPSSSLDSLLLLLSTPPCFSPSTCHPPAPEGQSKRRKAMPPSLFISQLINQIRSTVSGKWWWSWPPLTPFPPVKPQPFVPVFLEGMGDLI